ncbi:MAG: hypothetical protein BWY89_02060 [Bacteroidetes bacterium ADurb.BinA012]|nr:MAG: hypothetical protein BWY89_02060 [Bacteroidetes bacterium ADurb.BinA012]
MAEVKKLVGIITAGLAFKRRTGQSREEYEDDSPPLQNSNAGKQIGSPVPHPQNH